MCYTDGDLFGPRPPNSRANSQRKRYGHLTERDRHAHAFPHRVHQPPTQPIITTLLTTHQHHHSPPQPSPTRIKTWGDKPAAPEAERQGGFDQSLHFLLIFTQKNAGHPFIR
eukprot:scaffold12757_cov116-Isochrysis_galbana.AAC.1